MKQIRTAIIAVGFVLAVTAPVYADSSVEFGDELYAELCANCHGENRSGLKEFSDDFERFSGRLDGDTEDMPDFAGYFEEDEVAAMFAFLSSAQSSDDNASD